MEGAMFPSALRVRSRIDAAFCRVVDVSGALALIVFLAPLMLCLVLAISISDPGPIIFRHRRIGRGGREFDCLKFRSMVVDADRRLQELLATDPVARRQWAVDHKLRNDPRITKLGLFLRKSSFDELPQLWNVVRGDMSLVGPRPIVLAEVPRYGRFYVDYCRVRPGLTGLWQVSGRNNVSYRRRVALDVVYGRRASLKMDAFILLKTVPCIVFGNGAY
jgi:lipopolysaccharide/colanic/teichoic acid biosynthesis glycosyltransferase